MLNAESSVDGTLWNAFRHWEASASLEESIIRMEDFTSTCFAILLAISLETLRIVRLVGLIARRVGRRVLGLLRYELLRGRRVVGLLR